MLTELEVRYERCIQPMDARMHNASDEQSAELC